MAGRVDPEPYAYPQEPHIRRHGPAGWSDYRKYRPWLRDEFAFRCVFCLEREAWMDLRRALPVDHFLPRALRPDLAHDYNNLLYVCRNCNEMKSTRAVPDPGLVGLGRCLRVNDDGTIEGLNENGQRLIDELALIHRTLTDHRRRIIGAIRTFAVYDRQRFFDWMGYPEDLPDLSQPPQPPSNSKPNGVAESYFAQRQRGELPVAY